jgi:selenide, water dikinase
VLRHDETTTRPADLVIGFETGDDAAVWRRPQGRALVSTADFFTPIVDDAHTWGRIAAANAASDVYAMGGTPLFALNLVAWPRDILPLELLADVLEGGRSIADEGGWAVVGGHTVDGPEPMYGQAVTGDVDEDHLMTNDGAVVGQLLVLTKPIGTGLVATAIKRLDPAETAPGGRLGPLTAEAIREMTRLNDVAARVADSVGAVGATDITGFGLLGHLQKMVAASGVGAVIRAHDVPLLAGVGDLYDEGFVPGGTTRNVDHVRPHITGDSSERTLTLLADAQTSGGLLFGCPADRVDDALAELLGTGHRSAVIGDLVAEAPGSIRVE